MRESGGRSRVSKVICGNIHGLNTRDRASLGCCDSLLQLSEFCRQCGLVSNCRRNSSKQRRNLRIRLSESENIIYEQKNISLFFVSEILSQRETRQSNSRSRAWRLIHLSHYQSGATFSIQINNTELLHFLIQIVTFSSSFSYSSENRETSVHLRHIVNQFHDQNRFSHSRASEQANLSSFNIRGNQVNHLYSCG